VTAPALVVASSYGAAGASTRVRVLEWLRFLGLEAEVHNYMGTANVRPLTVARRPVAVLRAEAGLRRLRCRPAFERLLVSRSMGPFTRGHVEADLLRRAGWGVYDFDDALQAERGLIHRYFGESSGWARAVQAADLVVAGNDYLAEAAAALNPDVRVIPSCVDPAGYPQKQSYTVGSVPRLVWLGSPGTESYLRLIAPALVQVHRITGARLTLISSGSAPLGELAGMTDRVTWAGPATDALLAEADCGLMPLPDDTWTRGKCAYKLLQYAAAGLPVIGSPVGVNARVLDELAGSAATDSDSWVEAVVELLRAPETERRARGLAARRGVEEHYSYTAWRRSFLEALHLTDAVAGVPGRESPDR
jgi:glycosyltransferase involved in cell wall biosynthesis